MTKSLTAKGVIKINFNVSSEIAMILRNMSNDDAGSVFKSLLSYLSNGPEFELSLQAQLCFGIIKDLIQKKQSVSKVRSEAGKVGMTNRWSERNSHDIMSGFSFYGFPFLKNHPLECFETDTEIVITKDPFVIKRITKDPFVIKTITKDPFVIKTITNGTPKYFSFSSSSRKPRLYWILPKCLYLVNSSRIQNVELKTVSHIFYLYRQKLLTEINSNTLSELNSKALGCNPLKCAGVEIVRGGEEISAKPNKLKAEPIQPTEPTPKNGSRGRLTFRRWKDEDLWKAVEPYIPKYGAELCQTFFDYWSEPTPTEGVIRVNLEKAFEVGRRLGTFAKRERDPKYRGSNSSARPLEQVQQEQSRFKYTTKEAAEMAAIALYYGGDRSKSPLIHGIEIVTENNEIRPKQTVLAEVNAKFTRS